MGGGTAVSRGPGSTRTTSRQGQVPVVHSFCVRVPQGHYTRMGESSKSEYLLKLTWWSAFMNRTLIHDYQSRGHTSLRFCLSASGWCRVSLRPPSLLCRSLSSYPANLIAAKPSGIFLSQKGNTSLLAPSTPASDLIAPTSRHLSTETKLESGQ